MAGAAALQSTARARVRLRIDPGLVLVLALAFGAAACAAPAATLLAALLALLALRRALGLKALALAALGVALGWARAERQLAAHAEQRRAAETLLHAPGRCSASARVLGSPSWVAGALRFDAELEGLDCESTHAGQIQDTRRWLARLYLPGPPALDSALGPALDLARGDGLALVADLAPSSEPRNFDLPDPRPAGARRGVLLSGAALDVEVTSRAHGVPALIDRARAQVRWRILATFASSVSGMARALVLGENDLDPEDERAFQRSGLSHLLAVSGTHLVLAVLALVRAADALLRRWSWFVARSDVRRPAALVGLCLAPLYADFAGGSGSAWRAAWMLCAVLGARALGRQAPSSRVLAASLAAGWLGDGLVVFDPSFMLSLAATAGLLGLGRRLDQRPLASGLTQPRRAALARLPRAITRASLTTLSASVPCVPLLLAMSPGLSLASVAANLLAAPLGEAVALPLCLLHALCWPWPSLERGTALVASGALACIRAVAQSSARVEWLYIELPPPGPWHLATGCAGAALCLGASARPWLSPASSAASLPTPPCASIGATRGPEPRAGSRLGLGARAALVACALLLVEAATRWPHSAPCGRLGQRLRVTALDVGQGDASLVDLPDGRLMLVDGGGMVGVPFDPGERVILPVLRARRRARLDIVVLTHPHPDHYGGLLSVAQQLPIGELWYGGGPPPASPARAPATGAAPSVLGPGSYAQLLELLRARGVPLLDATELCQRFAPAPEGAAPATIELLHPCPGVDPSHSANDNSLVLRLRNGLHAALLVGDAEHWAEQRLLAQHPQQLRADLLKVGHHGSRSSSSPRFLQHVQPSIASISSGIRNRFGHPHPEALQHLQDSGAQILRLDQLGSIQWQTNGHEQTLRTFAPTQDRAPARAPP